jgi:hypothetical protein
MIGLISSIYLTTKQAKQTKFCQLAWENCPPNLRQQIQLQLCRIDFQKRETEKMID